MSEELQDDNNQINEQESQSEMTSGGSILDKVLESKKVVTASLDPEDVIQTLINHTLDTREQTVLSQRHGLNEERVTLEEIGKKLGVTRERVRQIAKQALKKLHEAKSSHEHTHLLDTRLKEILERSGGLREEESLLKEFFNEAVDEKAAAYLRFFLDHLSEYSQKAPFKKSSWQLVGTPTHLHGDLEGLVKTYLENQGTPMSLDVIHDYLHGHDEFNDWRERFKSSWPGRDDHTWREIIKAYLELSEHIASNPFEEWGPVSSPLVKPKRMGDKIYLVLKKHGEPLHFNDITEMINEHRFDKRKAYAPTVHNELILDDRFVLVGRGIYALKEWGYEEGTVTDVLERILKDSDEPLTREELIETVLKERVVKEGTILLALTDKDKFQRLEDGRYALILGDSHSE